MTTIFRIHRAATAQNDSAAKLRSRDLGLIVGTMNRGEFNAITDVDGVLVGHATVVEGEDIRTGVTAIIPGAGNLYEAPVPACRSITGRVA